MSRLALLRHKLPTSVIVGGAPAPLGGARFLNSGDGTGTEVTTPIVRQVLYRDPGSFSNTPTSYADTVYAAGTAVETGAYTSPGDLIFIVSDEYAGLTLQLKATATNGSGTSSSTNDSTPTSAVAAMSATNGITNIVRSSSAGVTPPVIVITIDKTKVLPGDSLRVRESADGTFSGTLAQDQIHFITSTEWAAGSLTVDFSADGLATPGVGSFLDFAVEMTSPGDAFSRYTYPGIFSPSDALPPMVWSPTDKNASVAVSSGNLTAAWGGGGSSYGGVRASRRIAAAAKAHAEFLINNASGLTVGIASSTQSLSADFQPELSSGGAPTNQAATLNRFGQTDYNGSYVNGGPTFANGDTLVVEFDDTASKVWWAVKPSGGSVGAWFPSGSPASGTGGLSVSGMTSTRHFAAQCNFSGSVTANYAGSFAVTPSTGFGAA